MIVMWSKKRSKVSWMGHGAWMGIAWGNGEDEHMGPKQISWNVTCFGGLGCLGIETYVGLPIETWHVLRFKFRGSCCGGSGCLGIETYVELPIETWHVLVGSRFWGSSFVVHNFWPIETNIKPPQSEQAI
jgi:hypothetical protein